MSDFKLEKNFGEIVFAELNSNSASDFEDSFMEYIHYEKASPYFTGFIKKLGNGKFNDEGTINTKNFETSFVDYFF